jgi:predicted transcriptional regulator
MTTEQLFPAKATTSAEQSDSIVVSFGAEWHQHLLAKDFSVVIRKRIPKDRSFKWLYFHINSPVGAICGRAEINTIFTATTKEAVALVKQINLPASEIKSYIGGDGNIGCYKLGAFQVGARSIFTRELASRMIYHPPQSFFIMSKQAKETVDQIAGFSTGKSRSSKLRKS